MCTTNPCVLHLLRRQHVEPPSVVLTQEMAPAPAQHRLVMAGADALVHRDPDTTSRVVGAMLPWRPTRALCSADAGPAWVFVGTGYVHTSHLVSDEALQPSLVSGRGVALAVNAQETIAGPFCVLTAQPKVPQEGATHDARTEHPPGPPYPALHEHVFLPDNGAAVIGRGASAKVRLGVLRSTARAVAVKEFDSASVLGTGSATSASSRGEHLRREVTTSLRCQHPNVVRCFGAYADGPDRTALVLELLDGGTAAQLCDHVGPLRLREAAYIMRHVLLALRYLHDAVGVVHRDVKPQNVLLSSAGDVKLADLGVAKPLRSTATAPADTLPAGGMTLCGTPVYMAPELVASYMSGGSADAAVLGAQCDHRFDIFSAGVLFQFLLTANRDGGTTPDGALGRQWVCGGSATAAPCDYPSWLPAAQREAWTVPETLGVPSHVVALINRMTHPDPSKRLSLAVLLDTDVLGSEVSGAEWPSVIAALLRDSRVPALVNDETRTVSELFSTPPRSTTHGTPASGVSVASSPFATATTESDTSEPRRHASKGTTRAATAAIRGVGAVVATATRVVRTLSSAQPKRQPIQAKPAAATAPSGTAQKAAQPIATARSKLATPAARSGQKPATSAPAANSPGTRRTQQPHPTLTAASGSGATQPPAHDRHVTATARTSSAAAATPSLQPAPAAATLVRTHSIHHSARTATPPPRRSPTPDPAASGRVTPRGPSPKLPDGSPPRDVSSSQTLQDSVDLSRPRREQSPAMRALMHTAAGVRVVEAKPLAAFGGSRLRASGSATTPALAASSSSAAARPAARPALSAARRR